MTCCHNGLQTLPRPRGSLGSRDSGKFGVDPIRTKDANQARCPGSARRTRNLLDPLTVIVISSPRPCLTGPEGGSILTPRARRQRATRPVRTGQNQTETSGSTGSRSVKAILGGFCVGLAALTGCALTGCASGGGTGSRDAAPAPRPAAQAPGTP